jgi:4'-phosphopantetheinyl transferase
MGLPHEIHFSISHTQGLISCAFSCFPEMGIDVENVQKRIEIIDLVTNVLSGEEFVQFNSTTSSQQKTLFFKLWTAKEAYLKAHGLGLIDNLSDISFNINLEKDQVDLVRGVSPREDTASWAFVMSTPTPQHQMTLAFKKRKSDPTQVIHHFAALPF